MFIDYINSPSYTSILAILCIAVGLAIATSGYRFRRAAMTASALFASGDLVVNILFALDDKFLGDANWYYLSFFGAGLVFSAAAFFHTKTGAVLTGFWAGVALATMILYMVDYRGSLTGYNLVLGVAGVVCAALTLVLKKPGLVAATGFVGASVFMTGVRFFVYKKIADDVAAIESTMTQREYLSNHNMLTSRLNSAWWSTTAVYIAFFVFAAVVQHFVTARGIDHDTTEAQMPDDSVLPTQYTKVQTPQQDAKPSSGANNSISLV